MIQFKHTYKTYVGEVCALKDVNLSIDKGEFVFLTGPSGAGKTTLFKLISAFDRASSGSVNVAGFDLNRIKRSQVPFFRRRIGVIYQDFKLLKDRTVFENVAMPLEILGCSQGAVNAKVSEMLSRVSLSEKKNSFPEQLSGGEQQRVAIARAVIHQPGVLIADEPTGNLDPGLSEEIMDLLESVNAQGTTVFVATHDHEMVGKRNKRLIQIASGEVEGGILC